MNRISIVGVSHYSLSNLLDDSGIKYSVKNPEVGVVVNDGGSVIQLLSFTIPALATVFVAWLNIRPTRKLTITTKNKKVIHAEGGSVSEIEDLLEVAERVMAIAPNEKGKKQA